MNDEKERLITAQWILERQLHWIAAAEVKIAVIVAVDTAILGSLGSMLGSDSPKTAWMVLFASFTLFSIFCAIICAAKTVIPRLGGPDSSLIFFGKIQAQDIDDYGAKVRSISDQDLLKDFTDQIHRNSEIALAKHVWVKNALYWSLIAVFPWAGFIVMVLK